MKETGYRKVDNEALRDISEDLVRTGHDEKRGPIEGRGRYRDRKRDKGQDKVGNERWTRWDSIRFRTIYFH